MQQTRRDSDIKASPRGLTFRAVFIGLCVVVFFAALTPYNDYYLRATFIAGNFFPVGSILALVILTGVVNPLLLRCAPSKALRRTELATIWCIILVPSGIAAAGMWRYIISQIMTPYYRATPANRWDTVLFPHISHLLVPQDREAVKWFWEGLPEGRAFPWQAWLTPVVFWMGFTFLLFFCITCLVVLLRRQWVENERFTFPLVRLPLEMIQEPERGRMWNRFFRNPLTWLGVGIPVFLHGLSGLAVFYPNLWRPQLHVPLSPYLTDRPWSFMGGDTEIHIYPSVIGLTYLLSNDVAVGFWAVWFFEKFQRILLGQFNLVPDQNATAQIIGHESYGATLALIVMALWAARRHCRDVWHTVLGRQPRDDSDEIFSYRVAVVGWGVGSLAIVTVLLSLRVPLFLALAFVFVAYAMFIGVTWAATNGGLLLVQMPFVPDNLPVSLTGSKGLDPRGVISLTLLEEAYTYDLRETLMPSMMHSQKVADEVSLSRRKLFAVCAFAVVMASFVALGGWLWLCYTKGAVQLEPGVVQYHAQVPWRRSMEMIDAGLQPNPTNVSATVFGATAFAVMQSLRLRFAWWGVHPVGLLVMRSWALRHFWFPIFLGWLFKRPIVQYGGLAAYNRARPFFLGLILGDMLMAATFLIVGFITGKGYSVLPL